MKLKLMFFLFISLSGQNFMTCSAIANEQVMPPVAVTPLAAQDSGKVIQQVMQEPIFNRFKSIDNLRYRENSKQDKVVNDKQNSYLWLLDLFEVIGNTIAFVFEMGLWILALLFIIILVKYREHLHFGFTHKHDSFDEGKPQVLFGLDVRKESLPENVSLQAMQFYQDNNYRAALALLYRAALSYMVRHYQFNLEKGATEGDCLVWIKNNLPLSAEAERHYFIELTRAWQLTAYAHRNIPAAQMKQLCLNWSDVYETISELHNE